MSPAAVMIAWNTATKLVVMRPIAETADGRRLFGNRPSSLAFSLVARGGLNS